MTYNSSISEVKEAEPRRADGEWQEEGGNEGQISLCKLKAVI